MNIIRKKILIVLSIFLFYCSSSNQNLNEDFSIIGEWKMIESYISAGGPQFWVDVENGFEYTFFRDRTFISSDYFGCTSGKFNVGSDELSLEYDCDGIKEKLGNSSGITTYKFNFDDGYLLLTSTTVFCVEGCSYKFEKIKDQN